MAAQTGFWDEVVRRLREKAMIGAWALISLVFAVGGPFGNHAVMIFPERLVFWAGMTAVAFIAGMAIGLAVERHLGETPRWRVSLVTAGIVALLMAPPLRWMSGEFTRLTGETAPGFAEVEALVFLLSLGLCSIRQIVEQRAVANPQAPLAEPDAPREARLLSRLDPEFRGAVLWVTVRDHYVDVRTTVGEVSLLMRFSDAIAELDGMAGLQIHRSHWVAEDAVVGLERENGKLLVLCRDGTRLPVSRSNRTVVETRFRDLTEASSAVQA
jgi:hypothetical protein